MRLFALAKKIAVEPQFVEYLASGEIQNSAASGVWDVTFMPVDEARKKFVDFGSPYHLLQSTYLVAGGAKLNSIADVNAAGVRIAGVADTATYRASQKASPNATHIAVAGVDAAVALMLAGKADAIPLSRESLTGLAAKIPGSRILDGGILDSTTAVAVPKNKPAALAYVSAFIEEEKASGAVRRSFDKMGLTSSQVAPAGMRP
jgi:polar amino acid transport system substrate-binding protein